MHVVLGMATGLLAAGSAVLVAYVPWWRAPLAALACLIAVVGASFGWAWFLARRDRSRDVAPVVTSGAMFGTALFIGHAVFTTFVGAEHGLLMIAAGAVVLAALGQAMGWAAARAHEAADRSVKLLPWALGAVAVCGAASLIGLTITDRASEMHDYEVVAALPPLETSHGRFVEERASTQLLGRTCIHHRCLAHVQTGNDTRSLGPEFEQDAPLRLLRSPARQTLLLEARGHALAVTDDRPAAWDWRTPSMIDTGAWLGAFPALVALAMFGLCTALVVLALRGMLSRRRAEIEAAAPGVVEDGWLRVFDGTGPRRVAVDKLDGPVLVSSAPRPGAPYRGDGQDLPFELVEGDKAALIALIEERARTLDAAALGIAACFVAPLLAAFAAGSLFY